MPATGLKTVGTGQQRAEKTSHFEKIQLEIYYRHYKSLNKINLKYYTNIVNEHNMLLFTLSFSAMHALIQLCGVCVCARARESMCAKEHVLL